MMSTINIVVVIIIIIIMEVSDLGSRGIRLNLTPDAVKGQGRMTRKCQSASIFLVAITLY